MAGATRPATHALHGFPAARIATLEQVFDTFVPGDAADVARRVRTAVETLDAVGDHAELRLLRLVLRSLEWPVANLMLTGQIGAFSRMSRRRRERVLLAWSQHPIARLRSAYQALKRLAMFIAWSDPGAAWADGSGPPRNPLWDRIGYAPAAPVMAPADAVVPMEVDRSADGPLELEANVVVVGSGAGGGVVAARLAAAGRSVLIVEAGHAIAHAALPRLEGEAWRDLYLDRGATSTHDLGVTILAGSGLGGGTTINWTTSFAPPTWLRDEWATAHGLEGFDTAQTDADVARLRAELDLCPPTFVPPKDAALLRGAAALGWEAGETERNAGPCVDCGSCGFGCQAGAKRSGLRAHLATAVASGARVLVDAPVRAVDRRGEQVTGVHGVLWADDRPRRPFRVRAPVVVVAAGALRTPLVLLRSGVDHPAMGHYLRLNPVAGVFGRMPDPVEAWIGPLQAARSLEFWRPGPADPTGIGPAHGGFVIESAAPHPALMAAALSWQGGWATLAQMEEAPYLAPLIGLIRDAGAHGGRVRWSRGGHPHIEYRLSDADGQTARRAMVEMARLARAAGARSVMAVATPSPSWQADAGDAAFQRFLGRVADTAIAPNRISAFSAHQMGTARAGADPRDHPSDPHGRVRRDTSGTTIRGLYVGDGSLFPTGSGVNPMLTIMVLAERVARAVLADA